MSNLIYIADKKWEICNWIGCTQYTKKNISGKNNATTNNPKIRPLWSIKIFAVCFVGLINKKSGNYVELSMLQISIFLPHN